ncbi:GSCFA domain-containing protein [Desulfosarcina variabilis]|uniref:GSCFA domain-containing protein n=1 Tax=Desulfosarcina variabilis TaxID=2300 RepID=UPI003AFA0BAA
MNIQCQGYPIINEMDSHILCMGSCFADFLAKALRKLGFSNAVHIASCCWHFTSRTILEALRHAEQNREFTIEHTYKTGFLYNSALHYRLSSPDPEILIKAMNQSTKALCEQIKKAELYVLTLGNATYMRHAGTQHIVTATPAFRDSATFFNWYHSDADSVGLELTEIYDILTRMSSRKIRLILTVSPQRYNYSFQTWAERDDFFYEDKQVYSNFNKAILLCAVHNFIAKMEKKGKGEYITYFPSYEIVLDELRSEQIFDGDGLHVRNPEVPNYVANRFINSYCSKTLRVLLNSNTPGYKWPFGRMFIANCNHKIDVMFFEQCLDAKWNVAEQVLKSIKEILAYELESPLVWIQNFMHDEVLEWAEGKQNDIS